MLRNVGVFIFLGLTEVVLSASTDIKQLPCPTVSPTNTSVEQVLGDWYFNEVNIPDRIPQTQICNSIEVRDLQTSESEKKSFHFFVFKFRNGTERDYVVNMTYDVSSECPGHWINEDKDGYITIGAATETRNLICLVLFKVGRGYGTMILSREELPKHSQVQDIKDKMRAAGIVWEGHVIRRNGTLC